METIRETTITSANAVLLIRAPGLVDSNQTINGFAPDTGWSSAEVQFAETMMGIDGKQAGGFTPFELPFTISLLANSKSQPFFNILIRDMLKRQEVTPVEWSLTLSSIRKRYSGSGFLANGSPVPTGGSVLQPTNYTINSVVENIEDI